MFNTQEFLNKKSKRDEEQMTIIETNRIEINIADINSPEINSPEINRSRLNIENNENNNKTVKNNSYFSYTSKKPVKLVENIYYFN